MDVITWLPLVGFAPVQLPDATQLVASVDDHVRVVVPPLSTLAGLAVMLTVGRGATETFAVAAAIPPAPMHVSVKAAPAVMDGVASLPLAGLLPDQLPDATQLVALVEDHDNIAVPPLMTVPGLAAMLTVGFAGAGAGAGVGTGVGVGIGAGGSDDTGDALLPPPPPPHPFSRTASSSAVTPWPRTNRMLLDEQCFMGSGLLCGERLMYEQVRVNASSLQQTPSIVVSTGATTTSRCSTAVLGRRIVQHVRAVGERRFYLQIRRADLRASLTAMR